MLTRKTFKTRDANGCEFECVSYLNTEKKYIDGKIVTVVIESKYEAIGKSAKTLAELKKIIASL